MISKQAQQIKSSLVRDSIDGQTIEEKRSDWENHAKQLPLVDGIQVKTQLIDGVPCMWHTPKHEHQSGNVILYLRGGGLVEGSLITSQEWCSRLALTAGQTVVSVDFRLAPEHPYPAALNDVIRAYSELQFGTANTTVTSLGADSSGCLLALQLIVKLRDATKQLPASCFLLSPSVDLTFQGATIERHATADAVVSVDVLKYYARLYAGKHNLASPDMSPLYAKLHDLPKMLVFVDESEVLFDDAVRLETAIKSAGGDIQLIIGKDLWHIWPTWADFPEARTATKQIVEHINALLDQ